MIFIPLHLAFIVLFMYLYARHEADFSIPKLCMVFVVPIWLLNIASVFIGLWIFPIYFILITLCLYQWFYIGWSKSAAVAGSFCVYLIIFSIAFFYLVTPPAEIDRITGQTPEAAEIAAALPKEKNEPKPKSEHTSKKVGETISGTGSYHCADSYYIKIYHTPDGFTGFKIMVSPEGLPIHKGKLRSGSKRGIYIESEHSCWISYRRSNQPITEHVSWKDGKIKVETSKKNSKLAQSMPSSLRKKMKLGMTELQKKEKAEKEALAKAKRKAKKTSHTVLKDGDIAAGTGEYHCSDSYYLSIKNLRTGIVGYQIFRTAEGPILHEGEFKSGSKRALYIEGATSCWIACFDKNRRLTTHVRWDGDEVIVITSDEDLDLVNRIPNALKQKMKRYGW